jgi:pyrimidine-nucleoside phosphorylase
MRAVDVIAAKRDGAALPPEALRAFVDGVTTGSWPDYQIAALLMAMVVRGLTIDEAAVLTDAMTQSGERLDLREFEGVAVDKHSTGGVGDKLSLVIAPLAAACGAIVPMMSGRALGHTGGTLDKLDAIPGFRTRLSLDEMRAVLRRTGCALIGQTPEIAPADRRLYALRDVTATVESIGLICASILSKKLAEGIGALVLDVKVGRGAFMKTRADARELAEWLTRIAARQGLAVEALLTPMDVPLGRAVGNANEVVEAIETLKGRGPDDVEALSVRFAARMLVLSGRADDDEAERQVRQALTTGAALERFRDIVAAQGGDSRIVDDPTRMPQPRHRAMVRASRRGVVADIDAMAVGRASVVLGAGRDRADAEVDPTAGIVIVAPIGTQVRDGDALLEVCGGELDRVRRAEAMLESAVTVGDGAPVASPLVLETMAASPDMEGRTAHR